MIFGAFQSIPINSNQKIKLGGLADGWMGWRSFQVEAGALVAVHAGGQSGKHKANKRKEKLLADGQPKA